MNISEALHAAADDIEQNPHGYCFMEGSVPGPGQAGCMLGKLGALAGARAFVVGHGQVAQQLLGTSPEEFYRKVELAYNEAVPYSKQLADCKFFSPYDAAHVSVGMRGLARKYKLIPDDIRAIFEDRRGYEINQEFRKHEHV
jgi:hypothetical protein